MGASPHLALPDPAQLHRPSLPSPAGSLCSSDSCATSSSLSSSDSSSTHESLPPGDGDPAPTILKQEKKPQQKQQHQQQQQQQQKKKKSAVLEVNLRHEIPSNLKQQVTTKSLSVAEPLRERRCMTRTSLRKACCRCAGAFAADCAAVICCPCGVLSLLSFFLLEIPTVLARKMAIYLQTRLCMRDATSQCSSRDGESSQSIFTPTGSCREASEGEEEKQSRSIIRFSTQNLLEHFEAEHVGFGCLSQKRE